MNLKKCFAALLSCSLLCGAGSISDNTARVLHAAAESQPSEAAGSTDNPCNKQDDREAPYDSSRWIQPAEWNCPTVNPRDYDGGIMLFFDKIGLEPSYAPGKIQRVYFSIHGATEPVSYIKFHIFYDTRLTVKPNANGNPVNPGRAVESFTTGSKIIEEGQIAFYAVSDAPILTGNHNLFTIDFIVPEDAEPGEMYPIGLAYVDDGIVSDCFINAERDDAAKLQMTYVFTKGIYNGYIKILGEKKTTAAATTTAGHSAEPLWGDVNCDSVCSTADAVLLCRIIAEDSGDDMRLTEQNFLAADCDSDGLITIRDVGKLLSHLHENTPPES